MAYNDYSAPYGASAAGYSSPNSVPTAPTAPGQRTARVGSTARAAAAPAMDTAAPVINPQRQIMLQNMGLAQRQPSNPTFAYRQATSTLDAAAAANPPSPTVSAPAATPAWKGVPYALPQDNSAPVVSGSAPAANAAAPVMPGAATTAPAAPVVQRNRLSGSNVGSNKISEETFHTMWQASQRNAGGNMDKAVSDFADTAAKYNVDGRALVDHWQKQENANPGTAPSANGDRGYDETVTKPGIRIPINMLGSDKSGGTPAPGLMASERGQYLNGAPTISTIHHAEPGYTSVARDFQLGDTPGMQATANAGAGAISKQAAATLPQAQIRDDYQAPFGSNARDQAVAPIVNRGPTSDQVASAKAVLNSLPPTERERFNANVDVAKAAAAVPLAKVDLQNQGKQTVAQTAADARRDATNTRATSNENVANTKAQSADSVAQTRANSAKEVQQLKNVGQADAAKLRTVIGGKAGDPITAQQKAFIMAFSKTAATDENFQPRKFEDRLAEAQKIMGAGAQGAQQTTANNAAPSSPPAQTASAQQAGDQVYQGFVYRQGADGQYHKVGPAQQ